MSASSCIVMISLKVDLESELNRCIDSKANGGVGRTGGRYKGTSEYPRSSLCTVVMSDEVVGEWGWGVGSRMGECWSRRRLWKRGEKLGRFTAIRPTLISTIAHIAKLFLSSICYLVNLES